MTKSKAVLALQVAVASGTLSQATSQVDVKADGKVDQATLNQLSMASIEESWIQVPRMCKDKSFNAEPHSMKIEERSQASREIFRSLLA